ncbi:MAG: hypothetical protein ABIE84_05135 [bacterium]
MKKISLALVLFLAVGLFVLLGCTTVTSSGGTTATLAHMTGFDFNTGTATDEYGVADSYLVNWAPEFVPVTIEGTTYADYSIYIWHSQYGGLADGNQHHMGAVALSTITNIPTTWESGSDIWPLIEGHSYVIKCTPEGYAAFYVTNIDSAEVAAGTWEADVEYKFTTGTSF